MRFSIILLGLAGIVSSADALGINCRGSSQCSQSEGTLDQVIDALQSLVNDGHAHRHYAQGQQLACAGLLCAFFQRLPGGENAQVALNKARDLRKHGCKGCGSCPTKPGNNVDTGELTVNYVTKPCCSTIPCYCL